MGMGSWLGSGGSWVFIRRLCGLGLSKRTYARGVTDQGSPDAGWLKHLEFIQAVITRLANDSFLMKGWALTVTGAFYGFAVKGTSWQVAAIGLMPVLVFWGLDAYFLRQERLFRGLYDQVRQRNPAVEVLAGGSTSGISSA